MMGPKDAMLMACCKLYISECRNQKALSSIAAAAAAHTATEPLLNTFPDQHYNRVGYTLAAALSRQSFALQAVVLDMVHAALVHIDLREHTGSHPRLGVVDHICLHPLGSTSLPAAGSLACSISEKIGSQLAVPTYLYGAAHAEGRPLDAVRRALGYFSADTEGQWLGSTPQKLSLEPDFGPKVADPKSGVVVVGACPWIANYNIPVMLNDLKVGARIARKVSGRGGGLPAVQAMALLHGPDRIEIACNLTDAKTTSAVAVQEEVQRLAGLEGLSVEPGYFTDYSEEQITDMAYEKLFGHERKA